MFALNWPTSNRPTTTSADAQSSVRHGQVLPPCSLFVHVCLARQDQHGLGAPRPAIKFSLVMPLAAFCLVPCPSRSTAHPLPSASGLAKPRSLFEAASTPSYCAAAALVSPPPRVLVTSQAHVKQMVVKRYQTERRLLKKGAPPFLSLEETLCSFLFGN